MTDPWFDVATIGDAVIDLTSAGRSADGNVLYERNPGGSPANVAATVARLGGRSAFMGTVGNDHLGRLLAATLQAAGVETAGLRQSESTGTRLVFVELDEDNDRTFAPYASPRSDLEFTVPDVRTDILGSTTIFHTSMLGSLTGPIKEATGFAIHEMRSRGGLVSLDPNWAAPVSRDAHAERQCITELIALTDILKLSLPEFRFLLGDIDIDDGARELLNLGPRLILVTQGGAGAYYRTSETAGTVDAYRIAVADSTGAGDAFVGGLLFQLSRRVSSRQDLAGLDEQALREAVAFANACGACCAARRGSLRAVPDQQDVQRLMSASREAAPR